MASNEYTVSYNAHLANLKQQFGEDDALRQAVGGDFVAAGQLERDLLVQLGLSDGQVVVDVGCGSGRLASQLAAMSGLRYIGTDVVQPLLDYAQRLCVRPDWRFVHVSELAIPVPDQSADFVTMFSLLTHLRHEDSYHILGEAKRALAPSGRIVISFLEFRLPLHWGVFKSMVAERGRAGHVNQFIDRDAIYMWASYLGLSVEAVHDGDKPHISLSAPITWDDGRTQAGMGNLGQSVAILKHKSAAGLRVAAH